MTIISFQLHRTLCTPHLKIIQTNFYTNFMISPWKKKYFRGYWGFVSTFELIFKTIKLIQIGFRRRKTNCSKFLKNILSSQKQKKSRLASINVKSFEHIVRRTHLFFGNLRLVQGSFRIFSEPYGYIHPYGYIYISAYRRLCRILLTFRHI